jgi:8-oxo-dGTP diphosphatase
MPINTDPHVHNLIICANIFVRKDSKYLLLKRSVSKKFAPDVVHPIGGKLDPNENPYTGAQRELLEEAGITVKNMRLEAVILEITPVKDRDENWLIFHFSGDYASGEITQTEEGELLWFDESDIPKQKLFPSVKAVVNHILNPKDGTVFLTVAYDKEQNVIEISKKINVCAV